MEVEGLLHSSFGSVFYSLRLTKTLGSRQTHHSFPVYMYPASPIIYLLSTRSHHVACAPELLRPPEHHHALLLYLLYLQLPRFRAKIRSLLPIAFFTPYMQSPRFAPPRHRVRAQRPKRNHAYMAQQVARITRPPQCHRLSHRHHSVASRTCPVRPSTP